MTNDAERVSDIVPVAWRVVGLAGPLHAAITGNPETAEGWRASNFQVEPLYTADIIEAQSKALAEARGALQPFADAAADLPEHIHDMVPIVLMTDAEDNPADIVHIGDFRRALQALGGRS